MTGEVVNLRLARKRRAREEAEKTAAELRAQFGRSKAEAEVEQKRRDLNARTLDGHRRVPVDEP